MPTRPDSLLTGQQSALTHSGPDVIILSFSLLLCRTWVGERNKWIHQSGRTTVAAGSISALPSQQMLIEKNFKIS